MRRNFRIGEVAKATGLTPRALRHYEDRGLIRTGRDALNRRVYDGAALDRLRLIRLLRELDIPVPEIRQLSPSPSDAAELAARAGPLIAARLADLKDQVGRVEALLAATVLRGPDARLAAAE